MSFFGFENGDLEAEKRSFLSGGLNEREDVAVYNWGQDDYDGLGDQLLEGGDDLNDETFGGNGPVGKDFDFSGQTTSMLGGADSTPGEASSRHVEQARSLDEHQKPALTSRPSGTGRDSLWDSKSPFSVLPRGLGGTAAAVSRPTKTAHPQPGQSASPAPGVVQDIGAKDVGSGRFMPFSGLDVDQRPPSLRSTPRIPEPVTYASTGVRTLEEIEAEMRAKTQAARLQAQRQEQAQIAQLQQAQLQQAQLEQSRIQQAQLQQAQLQQAQLQREAQLQAQIQLQQAQLQQAQLQQAQFQTQAHKPPRMRTESPNMLREQSPSFYRQNEILYQRQLLEQQERLRMEHLERQMREQSISQPRPHQDQRHLYLQDNQQLHPGRQSHHQRGSSGPTLAELQLLQMQQQRVQMSSRGEFRGEFDQQVAQLSRQMQQPSPLNNMNAHNLQNIQMQQRMLAQLAQAEFLQGMSQGGPQGPGANLVMNGGLHDNESVQAQAMKKIMEAELMEAKRRRKAAKIAHMSRYNDLMTQSDKDFITRIQVSQLVTSDPYAEDFYAQVYSSLQRSRMGLKTEDERVLKFGSGEGVGLGLGQSRMARRPNAMQRMEQQVERIVSNARQREKEKGLHALHNLQGALGKTAGRSYKAAPRQLLQVDTGSHNGGSSPPPLNAHAHISKEDAKEKSAGAAKEAARHGRAALGSVDANGIVACDPISRREALAIIEELYDTLLGLEQHRREHPPLEEEEMVAEWEQRQENLIQQLWDDLRVMVPLETSNPHPFISILSPSKGKKILPRVARHFTSQQMFTLLTLLVACFSQLDVVIDAPLLDTQEDSPERKEADRQTHTFMTSVLSCISHVINNANLRLISGLLGLFMERCDTTVVAATKPGLSVLTLFLGRASTILEGINPGSAQSPVEPVEPPSQEDAVLWQNVFDHLFHTLAPHLLNLFPSTRRINIATAQGQVPVTTELIDQPVWQFLAAFALHSNHEQQQVLVATLREKIIDNVVTANKGWASDEAERNAKISNVNLFLHALGLDSSQITV